MSAPFTTAAGPAGTHYLSIQGPAGIRVPAVHRDYAAFVASLMSVAFEAGRRLGLDEALPLAFADCEALIAAGLLALAEDQEARIQAMEPGCPENARRYYETRAACLREAALAVSVGQFRADEADEPALAAARRAAVNRSLAAKGGQASTPAKAAAARANGRRGGRPKKSK